MSNNTYIDEDNNSISGQVNLAKLALNQSYSFNLNKEQDWVKELLMELNQDVNLLPPEMYLMHTNLNISLNLQKKYNNEVREYLIATGKVDAVYRTQCVRTLKEMPEELNFEFKVCFLDESLAQEPEYKDQTEAYVDNGIYELYFYKRRHVDLKEMLHENIVLNKNPYPKLPDSKELQ